MIDSLQVSCLMNSLLCVLFLSVILVLELNIFDLTDRGLPVEKRISREGIAS